MNNDLVPARVMVIDDDEVSRDVLAFLLQGQGYVVDTVDSGDAALLHLKSPNSLPRLVLADMQMPGTAGAELGRQLRERCGSGTTLLAMSGSQPDANARESFDGFLLKPFSMAELATLLHGKATEAKSATRASVLDDAVYEKLAVSMKRSQLDQLYTMCLEDAEKRIAGMRRAAAEGDDTSYRREAHSIKGGCGMVGAVELQRLAAAMEQRGTEAANHVASLDEFLLACERLRRILVERESSTQ